MLNSVYTDIYNRFNFILLQAVNIKTHLISALSISYDHDGSKRKAEGEGRLEIDIVEFFV